MVTAITDDTEARKKKGKKKKRLRNQSALRKGEQLTAFWMHWNNEQIYDYTIESMINRKQDYRSGEMCAVTNI